MSIKRQIDYYKYNKLNLILVDLITIINDIYIKFYFKITVIDKLL